MTSTVSEFHCELLEISSRSTNNHHLGEGFNAVIESVEAGLGAPDPQQLAEMDRMAFRIKGETSESEDGSFLSLSSLTDRFVSFSF